MTLRLSRYQEIGVEMLARAEGKAKSDVIREAIESYIKARRADPVFRQRLRNHIEAGINAMERLLDD